MWICGVGILQGEPESTCWGGRQIFDDRHAVDEIDSRVRAESPWQPGLQALLVCCRAVPTAIRAFQPSQLQQRCTALVWMRSLPVSEILYFVCLKFVLPQVAKHCHGDVTTMTRAEP